MGIVFFTTFPLHSAVYLTIFCSQFTIKCLGSEQKPRQGQETWNTHIFLFGLMWGRSCDISFEPPHDKTNKMTVHPAKRQISLGIRPVWSESSLCAQLVAKNPSFLHADSEDSDQTGQMPRLICVFAGCTATLLVLTWGGSFPFCYSVKHHSTVDKCYS